jgi:hypothetical protein
MTNSDWWARAKTPPQPETVQVRPRERVCTLRKDQHEATLETRAVHGVGQELIFSVNGHWRRMRVFKEHGPLLSGTVSATMTNLKARGWRT